MNRIVSLLPESGEGGRRPDEGSCYAVFLIRERACRDDSRRTTDTFSSFPWLQPGNACRQNLCFAVRRENSQSGSRRQTQIDPAASGISLDHSYPRIAGGRTYWSSAFMVRVTIVDSERLSVVWHMPKRNFGEMSSKAGAWERGVITLWGTRPADRCRRDLGEHDATSTTHSERSRPDSADAGADRLFAAATIR